MFGQKVVDRIIGNLDLKFTPGDILASKPFFAKIKNLRTWLIANFGISSGFMVFNHRNVDMAFQSLFELNQKIFEFEHTRVGGGKDGRREEIFLQQQMKLIELTRELKAISNTLQGITPPLITKADKAKKKNKNNANAVVDSN